MGAYRGVTRKAPGAAAGCALPTTATTARRQGSQLAWKKSANSVCSLLTTR